MILVTFWFRLTFGLSQVRIAKSLSVDVQVVVVAVRVRSYVEVSNPQVQTTESLVGRPDFVGALCVRIIWRRIISTNQFTLYRVSLNVTLNRAIICGREMSLN